MADWLDLNPDPAHVKREREKARALRKTDWWRAQIAAVAAMASGVESRGINRADTGAKMNMCKRYIP